MSAAESLAAFCSDTVVIANGELGLSIFAARRLLPGEKILTFSGPLITFSEAVAKGELESYALQIDSGAYLDTRAPGCYVNHSCDPNAGIVDSVTLVAIRGIPAGEEIRFDYSTTMDEDHWTMNCRCGASRCRKIITDFKYLPPDVQDSYLVRNIVQPFIAARAGPLLHTYKALLVPAVEAPYGFGGQERSTDVDGFSTPGQDTVLAA